MNAMEIEKKAAYDRARYQEKKADILAKNKVWRDANRPRMTRLLKEWNKKNPEKARASRQRYRKKHPEIIQKQRFLNRIRNSHKWESTRKFKYATDATYRDVIIERCKRWALKNPEKVRIASSISQKRRRARMRNAVCRPEGIKEFLNKFQSKKFSRCYYCQKVKSRSACEVDHIIPISKGGEHAIENLCISCLKCNRRKSAKLISQLILIDQQILPL